MKLLEVIREMMGLENADNIRLNDGAYTWSLDNLYDVIVNEEDENEYTICDGNIYRVGSDGYMASIPTYFQA